MMKQAIVALSLFTSIAGAQRVDSVAKPQSTRSYWTKLVAGAVSSILLHEAGHITAAYSTGAHPTFGFDKGRPTVYSGINSDLYPRRQFWFSSAGLNVQSVLDESILDVPHPRGNAFERGLLAGGIGTTAFYLTIGSSGSVSDVAFMSRMGILTKTQVTLLYGSVAALHTWRIAHNPDYANFFVRPSTAGLNVGLERRF